MREAIRQRLVAAIPALNGQAFDLDEETESAQTPYLVIVQGALRAKQYVDKWFLNNLSFRVNAGEVEYWDGIGWQTAGGPNVFMMTPNIINIHSTNLNICTVPEAILPTQEIYQI